MVSAATGVALIQLISWQSLRGAVAESRRQVTVLAIVWLALTLAFEFSIGHWVDKKSWADLLANYNVLKGRLWPVVLASLVAAPFLWCRVIPAAFSYESQKESATRPPSYLFKYMRISDSEADVRSSLLRLR